MSPKYSWLIVILEWTAIRYNKKENKIVITDGAMLKPHKWIFNCIFHCLCPLPYLVLEYRAYLTLFELTLLASSNFVTLQLYTFATLQLCNFATFQLCNFGSLQHCNIPSLKICNFATLQLSNYATFKHCNIAALQHYRCVRN